MGRSTMRLHAGATGNHRLGNDIIPCLRVHAATENRAPSATSAVHRRHIDLAILTE